MNCQICDNKMPPGKWKCPSCGAYQSDGKSITSDESILLSEVKSAEDDRLDIGPYNFIWGGGLTRSSVTLFGGMPGAGKSTILLQILDTINKTIKRESMYIATEEALPAIKARADRLGVSPQVRMVPAMSGVADIGAILMYRKPCAIVIDSLQGLIGSDEQMGVQLLSTIKKFSVTLEAPSIVISHVNKAGDYAGLMTFQHAVDTLLVLSPDEDGIRTLEVQKNRYGRAFIESQFEMTEHGLIPIENEENE